MTPETRGLDVFEGCGFENGLKGRKLMRRVLVQLKLKLKRGVARKGQGATTCVFGGGKMLGLRMSGALQRAITHQPGN